MTARQRIMPVRRKYNQWVANQTLEDYALRFTAKAARRFSSQRISQTAIGAISFLALEAIGGAITLSYGTINAFAAILVGSLVILFIGLPIARHATRHGVDIDLLSRGAGFGYIGSTVTSLIYASFTFILFAIEASIMSSALEYALGLPLWVGYVVSAVAVIPLVTHGVTLISRFQLITQPFWIVLNIAPFLFIAWADRSSFGQWLDFAGVHSTPISGAGATGIFAGLDLLKFGAASAVILALMAQIGEQVDFLRFLPAQDVAKTRHRLARFLAGAGWVVLGAPKMLAGSFLAVLALSAGVPADHAAEPSRMYAVAFGYMLPWPAAVMLLMACFVVVSQLKINVMNAYAGSLAWSNFFSRLTHSHPGRVVWLVFNVSIALLLMELGIYRVLEETLGVFSIIAMAWLSAISSDLFINKPLGLSPPGIEFKRAHLYDINPVGTGAVALATTIALIAHAGHFGAAAAALSTFIAMGVAYVTVPLIAFATRGRYYLARKPRPHWQTLPSLTCSICENAFEPEDMAYCPAYQRPICSLCCSLDARCHDLCKPDARLARQIGAAADRLLPGWLVSRLGTRLGRYALTSTFAIAAIGLLLAVIYQQATAGRPGEATLVGETVTLIFFVFAIITGIATWFLVLAHDTRHVAEEESLRQNALLLKEIEAHQRTDAELQRAKEVAEAANLAKSRYVVGLSHELRTPLNAVLGYAQVLERSDGNPAPTEAGIKVIRRSAEHLSGLIDGLLDISRIEAGRLQVYSNEINIQDFLDQIVDMFRPQAAAKRLAFDYVRSPSLPLFVRTDEKRLRQILVNLLSNAIKFTETGRIALAVDYRSQVASFTVSDTGRGIAATDQAKVFEPFGRGEEDGRSLTPGLGLGLTITKLLAETLGGEISLTSARGEGSTFRVRLMLSSIATPSKTADRRIAGYAGTRRTIVVVDDNADHRDLMQEILQPLGFTVLTADDGPRALELVSGIRPDAFLLDIFMPGMSGWDLLCRLRALGHTAPAIMLSANIGDGASAIEEDARHDDTLAKPFDMRQLLDKLGKHLGLEWLDADQLAAETGSGGPDISQEGTRGGAPRETEGHALSARAVRELINLGEIGYVRGIEAKLEELAETPGNGAIVATLRGHIQAFDFARYTQTLESLDHAE
ncbi:signal transduction histidine kinase [Breoghania corrubedonensis]|uniref:histidine kinase n=1 Tax=Breoghania corrubedonensis TaxID=665038 RepID=A0A2T5V5N8_9HYPH|nr:ATP-binding protein [Breoghania corrubedonensis]PTW59069.1 signal transduction histidine kinase [Breoghania corrubedonensis]